MPQTCVTRCVLAGALMSAVVGGLAYGTAEQKFDNQQEQFRQLAEEECLANDPASFLTPAMTSVQEADARLRRLHTLHKICSFAMEDYHHG